MKRILSCIFIVGLIIIQTSCSKNGKLAEDIISPDQNQKKPQITILFNSMTELDTWNESKVYTLYKNEFEKAYGVKVNLKPLIMDAGPIPEFYMKQGKEYREKVIEKLQEKNGPELIYQRYYLPMAKPIIAKSVVKLKGKIKNMDKIYKAFLGDNMYYVPISVEVNSTEIQKDALEKLGIKEQVLNWNNKKFNNERQCWAALSKPSFRFDTLTDIIWGDLADTNIFKDNRVSINTTDVKAGISKIRKELFSSNYRWLKNYTYKNYYNMIFDTESDENLKSCNQMNSSIANRESFTVASSVNVLNTNFTSNILDDGNAVSFNPHDANRSNVFESFMVNKNGKNLKLAYEFINGLLRKKTQMEIYKASASQGYCSLYPVSKEVEKDIRTIEAKEKLNPLSIKLKREALEQIKKESSLKYSFKNEEEEDIYSSWYGDIFKYIFAKKPYRGLELSKELKALEDKYKGMINQ